jgi:hypothetical protein
MSTNPFQNKGSVDSVSPPKKEENNSANIAVMDHIYSLSQSEDNKIIKGSRECTPAAYIDPDLLGINNNRSNTRDTSSSSGSPSMMDTNLTRSNNENDMSSASSSSAYVHQVKKNECYLKSSDIEKMAMANSRLARPNTTNGNQYYGSSSSSSSVPVHREVTFNRGSSLSSSSSMHADRGSSSSSSSSMNADRGSSSSSSSSMNADRGSSSSSSSSIQVPRREVAFNFSRDSSSSSSSIPANRDSSSSSSSSIPANRDSSSSSSSVSFSDLYKNATERRSHVLNTDDDDDDWLEADREDYRTTPDPHNKINTYLREREIERRRNIERENERDGDIERNRNPSGMRERHFAINYSFDSSLTRAKNIIKLNENDIKIPTWNKAIADNETNFLTGRVQYFRNASEKLKEVVSPTMLVNMAAIRAESMAKEIGIAVEITKENTKGVVKNLTLNFHYGTDVKILLTFSYNFIIIYSRMGTNKTNFDDMEQFDVELGKTLSTIFSHIFDENVASNSIKGSDENDNPDYENDHLQLFTDIDNSYAIKEKRVEEDIEILKELISLKSSYLYESKKCHSQLSLRVNKFSNIMASTDMSTAAASSSSSS